MREMDYFDYQSVAGEAGLTADQLDQLRRVVLRDYPNDALLFELHMLRACRAILERRLTVEEALSTGAGAA